MRFASRTFLRSALPLVALAGACALRPPRTDAAPTKGTAPAVTVLRGAPVADGFYLVPVSDGEYRRREIHWSPGAFERRQLYQQLDGLHAGGCAKDRASLPRGLPEELIQVEKLGERFVIYDPCDGTAPRLAFMEGLAEFHPGGGEPALVALASAEGTAADGFELVGRGGDCTGSPLTIQLVPLKEAGWYRVVLPDGFPGNPSLPWVRLDAAGKLDTLVNVCEMGKTLEYPFARDR
jgi:hypothetical protein